MSPSYKEEPVLVDGPLTQAQRQANSRAKRKGEPPRFVRPEKDSKEFKDQAEQDLQFAKEWDETGEFYKSECRPMVDLYAIFYGTNILEKEKDEESDKLKKPGKESNHPNPSKQKITIKAITYEENTDLGDGLVVKLTKPIEPSCWVGCDHKECGKEHRKDLEVDEVVSFKRWLELRDRARKDLFWLARMMGKGLFHSVHQYICDQYVSKNFDGLLFPGYDLEDYKAAMREQQNKRFANVGTGVTSDGVVPTNELLLNEARGGYKSTVDGIDCAQWVINRPEIRILVITAFRSLAKKRAKEIKAYFYLPSRGIPSTFQILFPEFVTRGVAGRSDGPLKCPANDKNFFPEYTMWFSSTESTNTGQHCCILKADDIVDLKNSADEDMRTELKYDFDSIKTDLLDPWGFVDVTGTRYFTDDMYGERFKPNSESKRVSPFRYSCRGVWTLSTDDQILYNQGNLSVSQIIQEQRGKLIFPAKNNWTKLRNIYDEKGERNFKNQQMNEATDAADLSDFVCNFTKDSLLARLYPKDSAPKFGDTWILWDLAYSQSATSDYSVGVVIKVSKRQDGLFEIVVMDAQYGKWKSSELATNMVLLHLRNPEAKGILVEKINGLEWLLKEVSNSARYHSTPEMMAKIASFEIDNSRHAKRNRIKNLELLLVDSRLHFVSDARWNDECFKQFSMYNGEPSTKSKKDDFCDAVSFIFQVLPKDAVRGGAEDTEKTRKEREQKHRQEMLKALHNRMFSDGSSTWTFASTYSKKDDEPPPSAAAPARPPTAREAMLSKMMSILPPSMRRRNQ